MWSLRKAAPRKSHKERSQLESRKQFGLLEKKKDYQLRARDFHRKQDFLTKLKRKATLKNKDEFYFGMINATTSKGEHIKQRNQVYTHEQQQLMKSQDLNYIQMHLNSNSKKIEKMKPAFVHQGTHTIFCDNVEEFDPVQHFDTVPELLHSQNRLRKSQLEEIELEDIDEANLKEREREARLLENRLQKQEKLVQVRDELALQKELMKKGAKKKIGEDKKGLPVYKWLPRRKK
jgi:U3 small nucleolar RNA-associated protein 11